MDMRGPGYKPVPLSRFHNWFSQPDRLERIHTMQHEGALLASRATGFLSGLEGTYNVTSDRPQDFWFKQYTWMRDQMAARLPEFSGSWPIWAWPKRWNLRRLDRKLAHDHVLVTALVPRRRILPSDFTLWESVLNDFACAMTEDEWQHYHPDDGEDLPRAVIQGTWPRIFDLRPRPPAALPWIGTLKYVQLSVDRIYVSEITRVRRFP